MESEVCFISFTDGTYVALVPFGCEDSHSIEEASDRLNVQEWRYRTAAASAEVISHEEYEAYAKEERERNERNQRAHDERELRRLAQKLGASFSVPTDDKHGP